MKPAILSLILVLAWVTSVAADIIHMRDGTVREGKIVAQTEDAITLEVAAGSAKAQITINRADIDRIEAKASEADVLQAEYEKRYVATDKSNPDAVVGLAKWCMSMKLYANAETLLKKLAEKGGDSLIKADLALAGMEYDRKRPEPAKAWLKVVLEKDPNNAEAKALSARIVEDEKRLAEKSLVDAIDLAGKGKYEQALDKLEAFHDHAPDGFARELLGKTKFPGGVKFEDYVADVRLHVPCSACKSGLKVCPTCKGKVNEDLAPCKVCGGFGTVICSKCGGTGVAIGEFPDWELTAMVHALEQLAANDTEQFQKLVKDLAGDVPKEKLVPLANQAELAASRATYWLDEVNLLAEKRHAGTAGTAKADREKIDAQVHDLFARIGDLFDKQGIDQWAKLEAGQTGMLSQDKEVRQVRDDLSRALYFYGKTRRHEKDPFAPAVAVKVTPLGPLVAKVEKVVDHNVKALKGFEVALKALKDGKLAPALDLFVDIVKNSSKFDLAYLSNLTSQKINVTLAEAMAACRFELGKEKGDFGETTEYEREAFMKKLLAEGDAMAQKARDGYANMQGNANSGVMLSGVVNTTRDQADHARKWLRAALQVPYNLSAEKRKQVSDEIGEMSWILGACATWFNGSGLPGVP